MMRIITGSARGTKLETLEGENTRPTSERAKMAIFNTLQFDIEGRKVLDLFGGSGQMALEALSRGAASAFICEADNAAFEVIKRNARKTKLFDRVRLVCTDYKSALRSLSGKEKFNIIFLDPPYNSDYLADSLKKIAEAVQGDPNDVKQCRRLINYYLPTVTKLAEKYIYLKEKGNDEKNVADSLVNIEGAFRSIDDMLKKQLDALFANDALDIETDITVLEAMLKNDKLN